MSAAEIPIEELDEQALDLAIAQIGNQLQSSAIANTGKPCGDSHISTDKTCHVGETEVKPLPFGLKRGDTFFYIGKQGPELHKAVEWDKTGFFAGEAVQAPKTRIGNACCCG